MRWLGTISRFYSAAHSEVTSHVSLGPQADLDTTPAGVKTARPDRH
jgi:hypothetical protein